MCPRVAVFASLIFAGCSGRPANQASRIAATEANLISESLTAQLEAENTRRAHQHVEFLSAVQRAKGEGLPPRVPELAQGAAMRKTPNRVAVRVWACSPAGVDRESASMAEMTGRQLLLLARGASLTVGGGRLNMSASASIPGVRVTEKKQTGAYTVVQLDASVGILVPSGMQKIQAASFTGSLYEIIATISQSVEDSIRRHRETHPTATNGFVILRKMELLSAKSTPKCRYQLEIYADEP